MSSLSQMQMILLCFEDCPKMSLLFGIEKKESQQLNRLCYHKTIRFLTAIRQLKYKNQTFTFIVVYQLFLLVRFPTTWQLKFLSKK
jgi:hypothetical protein